MATLNLPAWGYGLRYRHGLFKQIITKKGQEEIPEDWLEVMIVSVVISTYGFLRTVTHPLLMGICRNSAHGKL